MLLHILNLLVNIRYYYLRRGDFVPAYTLKIEIVVSVYMVIYFGRVKTGMFFCLGVQACSDQFFLRS